MIFLKDTKTFKKYQDIENSRIIKSLKPLTSDESLFSKRKIASAYCTINCQISALARRLSDSRSYDSYTVKIAGIRDTNLIN